MSLPAVLNLTESSFGDAIPYLPIDEERRSFWLAEARSLSASGCFELAGKS